MIVETCTARDVYVIFISKNKDLCFEKHLWNTCKCNKR